MTTEQPPIDPHELDAAFDEILRLQSTDRARERVRALVMEHGLSVIDADDAPGVVHIVAGTHRLATLPRLALLAAEDIPIGQTIDDSTGLPAARLIAVDLTEESPVRSAVMRRFDPYIEAAIDTQPKALAEQLRARVARGWARVWCEGSTSDGKGGATVHVGVPLSTNPHDTASPICAVHSSLLGLRFIGGGWWYETDPILDDDLLAV